MGFSKRKGLRFEQGLSPSEYEKMRSINRIALCKFLEDMKNKKESDLDQNENANSPVKGQKKQGSSLIFLSD
jgi:hypothetical protein